MSISTSTLWQTVFNIVKNIDYTHPQGAGYKYVYGAFPDPLIDDQDAYPIIVVNPIDLTSRQLTYNIFEFTAKVRIDIFTTSASLSDTLLDKVIKQIETDRSSLENAGMYSGRVSSSGFSVERKSGMKIHIRSIEYEFKVGECV